MERDAAGRETEVGGKNENLGSCTHLCFPDYLFGDFLFKRKDLLKFEIIFIPFYHFYI